LFEFYILSPIGYHAKLKEINRNPDSIGIAGGFAMIFDLTLLPTNVSFEALQIEEVGLSSTDATGYFAEPRNARFLAHETADVWVDVHSGNKGVDKAQMAELPPPWSEGNMTWPIPNRYRSKEDITLERYFCNTNQYFSVLPGGTATEGKFGWYTTVTTNRDFTYGRTNTQ
jgi:hypothetical protein